MRTARFFFLSLLLATTCLLHTGLHAQVRTVGKIYYDDASAQLGYTLFTPNSSFNCYLIENCGLKVHEWTSAYRPGMMSYLRTDGLLLRACRDADNFHFGSSGGNGGILELLDWSSNRLWEYRISDSLHQAHHDIYPMPNGNVLVLAWEKFNFAQSKQAGRDPNLMPDQEVWGEVVYEVKPIFPDSGIVVWEWHVWDHLIQDFNNLQDNYGVVEDHPELLDVNYIGISLGLPDWLHANSVAYNPIRDEIVISFRETSEIVIVDHSTTTAEAASHSGGNQGKGGDFLFRWGNPEAYRRGTAADKKLFEQHDAHWTTDSTRILIFNNGLTRNDYSTVELLNPSLDSLGHYRMLGGAFLPDTAEHTYATLPGDTIDSKVMGGAELLPNGNLLVSQAVHGRFVEFDSSMNRVWDYISPILPAGVVAAQGSTVPVAPNGWINSVFKCRKYPPDYPGLAGQTLPHMDPLELNPYPDTCSTPVARPEPEVADLVAFPNPSQGSLHIRSDKPLATEWTILDAKGQPCMSAPMRGKEATIDMGSLPNGLYILRIGKDYRKKVVLMR